MTDRQAQKELEVFGIFASVCSLRITPDSIEKRCPPEPDILCALDGDGRVAFEMVQLIDQEKIGRRMGDKEILENTFEVTYQGFSVELRDRLPKAHIFIRMLRSASSRDAISKIFDQLLLVGSKFEGDLLLPDNLKKIASVKVGRGIRFRPLFDVEAPSQYNPVPLGAITKKFEKSYDTSCPVELLAYFDVQGAPPEPVLKPLYSFIDARLADSLFRRAWVFDFRQQIICYQTMLKDSVVI